MAASAGQASGQAFVVDAPGGPAVANAVWVSLKVTGALTVDYRGDPATCASVGLCGVSGTVSWNVAGPGALLAIGYRDQGQLVEQGILALGGERGPHAAAQVRREPQGGGAGGLCTDAGPSQFTILYLGTRPEPSVAVGIAAAATQGSPYVDYLRTRCAGPTTGDISALLPTRVISLRALRRGAGHLDLSADKQFTSHGLAGTVHSTVAIRFGRVMRLDTGAAPPGVHDQVVRRRQLEVTYAIESVSGQVATHVSGLADPDLCGPLDACGLLGDVTLTPQATSGVASVLAEASTRHSVADLRRAVGLLPGRPPAGVSAGGFALWTEDAGSASTVFTRAGAPDCNDSQPLFGGGGVALDFTRGGVRALYGDGSGGGLSDPLRTRCEGPGLADVARAHPLATGTLPLSAFRSRRVTLHLNRGGAFSSDGYSGTTRSDVTVVLRRLRIRTHIQVYRFPALFARLARSGPPMERILAARIGRRDRSGYRARAHPRAAAGPAR